MGWLQLKRQQPTLSAPEKETPISFIENVDSTHDKPMLHSHPPLPLHTPDSQLPFVSPATIASVTSTHHVLWLIIDNIIYDCTDFISEHPGGAAVIESFVGKDCSWQFWRFHGEEHMESHGRALRVSTLR